MIATGPNGPETPTSVGLRYERWKIPSGGRSLDAYLVQAAPDCHPRAALLIFHGVGETISHWVGVQRLLYDHCISSVVFDYSGDGDSTGRGSVENLDQDASATYESFADLCFAKILHTSGINRLINRPPSNHPKIWP